jgi:hypothetical protein
MTTTGGEASSRLTLEGADKQADNRTTPPGLPAPQRLSSRSRGPADRAPLSFCFAYAGQPVAAVAPSALRTSAQDPVALLEMGHVRPATPVLGEGFPPRLTKEGSKRIGLILEIPDVAAFQEVMQSDAAAEAMKYDGVHPETLLILSEG